MGNAKLGQARADSLKSIPGDSNGTVQPIDKDEAFYDRGAIRAQRYCRARGCSCRGPRAYCLPLNLAHRLFATVGLSSGHAEVVIDGRVYRVRLSERA
jgi:hypothetical protein